MIVGIFVFSLSILALGGAYGWKYYLASKNVELQKELKIRRDQFNPDQIRIFKTANDKIELAKKILNDHIAVSQVFGFIETFTIENIRFTELNLIAPTDGKPITFTMRGYGQNYKTVAAQSDIFGRLEDIKLRDSLSDVIITNPEKAENDTVIFSLSGNINRRALSYKALTESVRKSVQNNEN
jgi:predicted CopG family antitoxin